MIYEILQILIFNVPTSWKFNGILYTESTLTFYIRFHSIMSLSTFSQAPLFAASFRLLLQVGMQHSEECTLQPLIYGRYKQTIFERNNIEVHAFVELI